MKAALLCALVSLSLAMPVMGKSPSYMEDGCKRVLNKSGKLVPAKGWAKRCRCRTIRVI